MGDLSKQIIRTIAVLCVVMLCFVAPTASAEVIDSFTADISINPDSSLSITEEIQYDFQQASRHGIYREIPISYETNAGSRRIFVDNIQVQQNGEIAQTKTTNESGNLRIRIGDPEMTITGQHTYTISYDVRGALNFFDNDTAELYWDIVGDQWEVPILLAEANVWLENSESVTSDDLTIRCFVGEVGSSNECPEISTTTTPLGLSAAASDITSGQAMTTVLNFPASAVQQPSALASVWWFLQANPLVFLPFLTLLISFFAWWRWGKDPEGRGVIVPQYEPPEDLKPILVGALVDDTVHTRDITAGIIYLAEQGFITIEREEKEWLLGSHDYIIRQNKSFSEIRDNTYRDLIEAVFDHEIKISGATKEFAGDLFKKAWAGIWIFGLIIFLIIGGVFTYILFLGFSSDSGITSTGVALIGSVIIAVGGAIATGARWLYKNRGAFSSSDISSEANTSDDRPAVRLSDLKQSQQFQKTIQKIKRDVMQDMRDRGWFVPKNNVVGGMFGVIILAGIALLMLASSTFGIIGVGSIMATIAIASFFSAIMKKKTKAGAILQEKLFGFEEFLSMTQKERLDFHNAPERSPKEFMEYLPYAVALEVEEKWAAQFAGIDMPPPAWYHGSGHFAAASFASDLSSFSQDYSQAASGGSGASGGGAAGGGMGGGGGGSW